MVVVNLYPFEETVSKQDVLVDEAIENIDIGGPSMLRSASKNFKYVTVVTDPADYERITNEIEKLGGISYITRFDLARKAFSLTAFYDSMIAGYFNKLTGVKFPELVTVPGRMRETLRYGENPHQESAFYTHPLINEVSVSRSKNFMERNFLSTILSISTQLWSFLKNFLSQQA